MHATSNNSHTIHHDPAQVQILEHKPNPTHKHPVLYLGIVGLVLVLVGAWLWFFSPFDLPFRDTQPAVSAPQTLDQTPIVQVGAETLYAEDVKYEQRFYPESERGTLEASIKERLINESIILQAGAEAGYIQLDEQVFNTIYKDREKRRLLLTEVEAKVHQKAAHRKGAVISVWFMNFKPGPIGYEAGQALALEKITAVHNAVRSGQMTIKQAGDAIRNDTSLAQVDEVYDSNAYFEFDTREGEDITYLDDFNQQLLALNEGEITPIVTGQDYERDFFDQPQKDAVYMFGQVTEIQADGNSNFDAWVAEQKSNYAIIEL